MHKLTSFFWFCSGADTGLLKQTPTESTKYVGIGATVFFTGIFAAVAAGYSLYTVFDNIWAAIPFGLLWGVMIFNLDRYIVSSMRKQGSFRREFSTAVPRIVLAVLISIVIAKPLELKIFEKEIEPELVVMAQEKSLELESSVKNRFVAKSDSLKTQIDFLKKEIQSQSNRRDELVRIAQEEADGTGGSKRRNLGPIYKVKKADADRAEIELQNVIARNTISITNLESELLNHEQRMAAESQALKKPDMTGLAARIEALDRVTKDSDAILLAHWFIILLFIAIETAPVFVKLMSPKGPYDNLLRTTEHQFAAEEIERLALTNAAVKKNVEHLNEHERSYARERLDASLKRG